MSEFHRFGKGLYYGHHKCVEYKIIRHDDIEGECKWAIHFDKEMSEKVFEHEDQLWCTLREAKQQTKYFIEKYAPSETELILKAFKII